MPFLGMRTVGDLSEEELARIGRETLERTLRGPQGVPTAAQRDFAMQVYRQIAPQLTPDQLASFGDFLQPYFQAPSGFRPTYATMQQARPLFLSQLEATGGDEAAISPWLRSVAQPLQDRSGLTASAALRERAWQQAMEGLGGWVRDPETGQLVPTAETQRALALAYAASLGETERLGQWYDQMAQTTAPTTPTTTVTPADAENLASGAKTVLSTSSDDSSIIRSATDAAGKASAEAQQTGITWQIPSFWQRIAAYFTRGGTDRLAPNPEVVQALQEQFATPQEALQAVNEAIRQAEQHPNIMDPNVLQALRVLQAYLTEKVMGNFWDWRAHVPFVQPGW